MQDCMEDKGWKFKQLWLATLHALWTIMFQWNCNLRTPSSSLSLHWTPKLFYHSLSNNYTVYYKANIYTYCKISYKATVHTHYIVSYKAIINTHYIVCYKATINTQYTISYKATISIFTFCTVCYKTTIYHLLYIPSRQLSKLFSILPYFHIGRSKNERLILLRGSWNLHLNSSIMSIAQFQYHEHTQ